MTVATTYYFVIFLKKMVQFIGFKLIVAMLHPPFGLILNLIGVLPSQTQAGKERNCSHAQSLPSSILKQSEVSSRPV